MATEATEQGIQNRSNAKVFISYSRKDIEFADRLDAALKARGFEPLIDRTDIYAFEEWWKRVEDLIARADTVVFVLSRDAVRPDTVALKEVAFAASLNKRFAPIVFRAVEDKDIPEALAKLNFIFFDDPAQFEQSADKLAEALNTDISWIRQHTDFGEQARRWTLAKGPTGLLLRSPVLEQAERWIASRPPGAPAPTDETQTFIRRSRQGATRRRNILTGSLAAGLVVALGLAGLAYWQWGVAEQQRGIAVEQRSVAEANETQAKERLQQALINQSRFLTRTAETKLTEGRFELAGLLARDALLINPRQLENPSSVSAVDVVQEVMQRDPLRLILAGQASTWVRVAFSPDGQLIATTSSESVAHIWDATTGARLKRLRGHTDEIRSVTFSPDGRQLLTASKDATARVWDVRTATTIAVVRHEKSINSAVFGPNGGQILTASDDCTARIWDATSGNVVQTLEGHTETVRSASFSFDGTQIVTASEDHTAIVWDAQTGAVHVLLQHDNEVQSAAFNPKGKGVLTTTSGSSAQVWDSTTGALVASLDHKKAVEFASYSADGLRIVTASADRTAIIWDAITGTKLTVLQGHNAQVNMALFSADALRVVTASRDNTARIWDARTGANIAVFIHLDAVMSPDLVFDAQVSGIATGVQFAAFSPDGQRILTAPRDFTIRVWDARNSVLRDSDAIYFAKFSPHERYVVTVSREHNVRVWDAQTGISIARLEGSTGDFSPDGRRIVTASGRTAHIWDTSTGELIFTIEHEYEIRSASYSPDGQRILTGSGAVAQVWNATTGTLIRTIEHEYGVRSARYSPDGQQILSLSGRLAHAWKAQTGERLFAFDSPEGFSSAIFSADGRRIVATYGAHVLVRDARTGAAISDFSVGGDEGGIASVAISPTGQRIVIMTNYGRKAQIWNAENGTVVGVLEGHNGIVEDADFSADGQWIVTGADDNTTRVWNAENFSPIAVLKGHERRVISVAFSSDGQWIVSGSEDGTARIWKRPALVGTQAVDYTSVTAFRFLTSEERDEYFLLPTRTSAEDQDPDATECDRLAANPTDPKKRTKGVPFGSIKSVGVEACRSDLGAHPSEPRFFYQLGRALAATGKTKEAIEMYLRAAELGYAAAHQNLGNIYAGPSVYHNVERAVREYNAAWEAGMVDAGQLLWSVYWYGYDNEIPRDRKLALQWLERGASAGSPLSQWQLAELFESGEELPVDLKRSLFHYILAIDLYDKVGLEKISQDVRYHRASLARNMPLDDVMEVLSEANRWIHSHSMQ